MRRGDLVLVSGLLALLAACGSDNGSTGSVAQPLAAPPAPLAPPPVGSEFDTREFRFNGGNAAIKPIAAYEKGATGKGVVLGILDTGINPDNPEIAGRLAKGSADFLKGGAVKDIDGHGTIVSSIIAGARNNYDGQGVAFEATLFSGRILESYNFDEGRTQAQIQADNIAFYNAFANGVEAARLAGSRSINLSIGFSEANVSDPNAPPPPRGPLDDAFDRTVQALDRAQKGGVIYVVAAGNEGAARPNAFARLLLPDNATNVPLLIVGAVDANNQIASFSNRAGSGADARYFLVAPGVDVVARDIDGEAYYFPGTSLAAPFVSGALGLLFQAFPNLSGQQAVDLLLRTATDLGAPGFDPVYGNGLLNIENAFKPQGQQSLALGAAHVVLPMDAPLGDIGGAFGNAAGLRQSLAAVTFLDSYGRAFSSNFSARLQTRLPTVGLHAKAVNRQDVAVSRLNAAGAAIHFSGIRTAAWQRQAHDLRAPADTRLSDVRMQLYKSLSPKLAFAAGTGVTVDELLARDESAPMLLLDDARLTQASFSRPDVSVGLLSQWRNWQISAALSYGESQQLGRQSGITSPATNSSAASLDMRARRWHGDHAISLGLFVQSERGQVLGSQSPILFGDIGGSRGVAMQVGWQYQFGPMSLQALAQMGRTSVRLGANALVTRADSITTSSFKAVARYDIREDAQLTLAVAQPLRVESGTAHMHVPTGYDYTAQQSRYSNLQANLAPEARELDLELGFAGSIGAFDHVQINAFHRISPGHRNDIASDTGVLLRWQTQF